jgi:hypothetical protein
VIAATKYDTFRDADPEVKKVGEPGVTYWDILGCGITA